MASMGARERWQIGLAVLTAYLGPVERRASDISTVVGDHDPREVLFGVMAVARDLLEILAEGSGIEAAQVLQALAEREIGNGI